MSHIRHFNGELKCLVTAPIALIITDTSSGSVVRWFLRSQEQCTHVVATSMARMSEHPSKGFAFRYHSQSSAARFLVGSAMR
jgi:hypothetical protein